MNKIEICNNTKMVIRNIIIDNGTKIISAGTGVVVKENGTLITAKHVVESEGGIYNGKIFVKGVNTEQIEYQPALYGFGFDINQPEFINPISIDLTVLKPVEKLSNVGYIKLFNGIAEVGTDIIMAGFPDDVRLPFHFDQRLNILNPEMLKAKFFFRQLMFKSGIIGNMQKIHLNKFDVRKLGIKDLINIDVLGATYWLDNHLTYGGSGGPIVNLNGELLGIVCEKAFTQSKMPNMDSLPSGTGMGLSHQLISWILPKV